MIHISRSFLAFVLLVVLASGLAACATNPITGRSQLTLVSEEHAIALGQESYNKLVGTAVSSGTLVRDEALVNRIRGITDLIIAEAVNYRADTADWNWEVQVLDEPENVNAFCMPGGKMGIYTGLIYKLDLTNNEVAQVMSHEVSHALLGHGAEHLSMGLLSSIMVAAATISGDTSNQQRSRQLTADIATQLFLTLPNSRTGETEADKVGIELAARAGFDPHAAVSLWQKMIASNETSGSKIDWLSTHPASTKRITALNEQVDGLMPIYLATKDRNANQADRGAVASQEDSRAIVRDTMTSETSSDAAAMSLEAMCDTPSLVDRAECLGQLHLGMSRNEVVRVLGRPNEVSADQTVLRFSDRYLQLDQDDRLIKITDRRPR